MAAPAPPIPSRPIAAVAAGCALLAIVLWWPLRHAAAYMDDHAFLVLARHLDDPAALVLQDPVGSYFYRPLVMALWWASERLFDGAIAAHYALNVGVHAANGVLLFGLARRLGVSSVPASLAALAFVAHPAAYAAIAWLCIRFDLFATAFGLAGLWATVAFADRGGRRAAAGAVAALAASMASKETGFGVALVALALLALPGGVASRRARIAVAAAIGAAAVALLAARFAVLRDVPELQRGLAGQVVPGIVAWLRSFPGFLVARPGSVVAVAPWALALAAVVAMAFAPAVRASFDRGLAVVAAVGLATLAFGVAAPSPIMAQIPMPAFDGRFDVAPLLTARFYYLPLAGLALAMAAVGEAIARAPRLRRAAVLLAALGIASLAATSALVGRQWARVTVHNSGRFEAAADAALRAVPAGPRGCKVYLLGTPRAAVNFREVADTAAKRALPRGSAALGCFVQAEHAPWFHILPRERIGAEAPLETIRVGGRPYPPLVVGNLALFYLRIPPARPQEIVNDPAATFLAWDGARFVDVTRDVREGRRPVAFVDNRPDR